MSSGMEFDYRKGRVFIQDRDVFYSPNCVRDVVIPPQDAPPPFMHHRLHPAMFTQPVRWSESWGWLGFIPLAPLYTSLPFEPFGWWPRIVECHEQVRSPTGEWQLEKRFKMNGADAAVWIDKERLLKQAALRLRLRHFINAATPPLPSSFGFHKSHKSHSLAAKMIAISCDWFGIWMGFLSYIVFKTEAFTKGGDISKQPHPCWYQCLKDDGFSPAWLDGLETSSVCSFDPRTPRAGVLMTWSEIDNPRPLIDSLSKLSIPLWFPWSSVEETAIYKNPSLAFLTPPTELLEEALETFLAIPDAPLAAIVMKSFFRTENDPLSKETLKVLKIRHSASVVYCWMEKRFLMQYDRMQQHMRDKEALLQHVQTILSARGEEQHNAAEAAASLPKHTMLTRDGEDSTLFRHWQDFFDLRKRQQAEFLRAETPSQRDRRIARTANPPRVNTNVYTWEKVTSSGGQELYMRTRVIRRLNEETFEFYDLDQERYCPLTNEWDLFEGFSNKSSGKDKEEYVGYEHESDDDGFDSYEPGTPPRRPAASSSPPHPPAVTPPGPNQMASDTTMSVDQQECLVEEVLECSSDILDTLGFTYGYVSPLGGPIPPACRQLDLEGLRIAVGFCSEPDVPDDDRTAMKTFVASLVVDKAPVPTQLNDLDDRCYRAISSLFRFHEIRRPCQDLFVFHSPRSAACDWALGVCSPEAAVYVCRYILSNPRAHTLITVARRLLDRGIRFHTLLSRVSIPGAHFSKSFKPALRPANYKFTIDDFESAMLACKTLLRKPQGRAAILRGGIVGRIAREYLSVFDVLDGPSIEVTRHNHGFFVDSLHRGHQYWDDDLTEEELATICGQYKMYTGSGEQIASCSWFPLPQTWTESGFNWLEWTERDELFFKGILTGIRHPPPDKEILQPRQHNQWRNTLRGLSLQRQVIKANRDRAKLFMDAKCAVGAS